MSGHLEEEQGVVAGVENVELIIAMSSTTQVILQQQMQLINHQLA